MILNNLDTHSLDDNMSLGIYRPNLETTKIVKKKIKNISKIIKELKEFK